MFETALLAISIPVAWEDQRNTECMARCSIERPVFPATLPYLLVVHLEDAGSVRLSFARFNAELWKGISRGLIVLIMRSRSSPKHERDRRPRSDFAPHPVIEWLGISLIVLSLFCLVVFVLVEAWRSFHW
jgi:hypothetical protein